MTTHHLALSRTVAASPQRVWQVITDLDRAAQTLSGVSRVERLTDGPYALGTRWRETRTMFGKATTEEMWVTALDPARSTTVEASSHGTDYRTVFDLTPTGSGRDRHGADGAVLGAGG